MQNPIKFCFRPTSLQYTCILTNDTTQASTKFDFTMYADDVTLASIHENFGCVTDVASLERELN